MTSWSRVLSDAGGARDAPARRRHVALTVPRHVKERMLEAAEVIGWALGDWVLAAAAEHGPRLRETLGDVEVRKRPRVEDATYTALYITADERDEIDDQAVACRLNRSAFVTAVARLGLGHDLAAVVGELRGAAAPSPSAGAPGPNEAEFT